MSSPPRSSPKPPPSPAASDDSNSTRNNTSESENSESVSFTLPPLSSQVSLSLQNTKLEEPPEIELHPASVALDDGHNCQQLAAAAPASATELSSTPTPTPHVQLAEPPVSPSPELLEVPQFKSPNVYINGLPPHFPEDQLFELCKSFGPIRSVRSFTRHVGERESGYGFVLFESVDSAERCIQSLRRFRNLHPTFSKQIHKIPGAPYAHAIPPGSIPPSVSSASSNTGSIDLHGDSFKNKMEKLGDPNSTNLYFEGLPLTIDESSLAALVSPYRIKSSRFFQTRLSDPPRIIAFVRFESRQASEEIIERLHGRMVRGWNDPGCRISVRFADTTEQRELRRTERTVKEGDQSPARLSMAQAALLNLRGRESLTIPRPHSPLGMGSIVEQQRPAPPPSQVPSRQVIGTQSQHLNISHLGFQNDFASNAAATEFLPALSPRSQQVQPPQRYPTALPRLPPIRAQNPISPPMLVDSQRSVNPSVKALFDTMRSNGVPFAPLNDRRYSNTPQIVNDDIYQFSNPDSSQHFQLQTQEQQQQFHRQQLTQQQQQAPATRNGSGLPIQLSYPVIGGSGGLQARGGYTPTEEYILQAHATQRRKPSRLDLAQARAHAQAQLAQSGLQLERDYDVGLGVRGFRAQAATLSLRGPATSMDDEFGLHSASHIRSTTLPSQQQQQQQQHSRHYQHNSLSIPPSTLSSTISPRQQQDALRNSTSALHHHHSSTLEHSKNNNINNSNNLYTTSSDTNSIDIHDIYQQSPSLVSPALTYSSRGSAASLSPATPFLPSFPPPPSDDDKGKQVGGGEDIHGGVVQILTADNVST